MDEQRKLTIRREMADSYNAAEDAVTAAQNAYRDIKKKIAAGLLEQAGLAIGDNIGVNGYSHRGKRMIIEGAKFENYFSSKTEFKLTILGGVLKKDGTIGQHTGEHIITFITEPAQ